jgi:PAS domain S-box-containing protein
MTPDPTSPAPLTTGADEAADERLRLRLELERARHELALMRLREADLQRREQALQAEQDAMRNSRLASLNLIEDAVDARNRMAQAQEQLQRERDLLEHSIESLPGVFYLIDSNGRFRRWNHEFEHVTGYNAQEVGSMHPLDFFTPGPDRDLVAERIALVFTHGRSEVEAGFRAKDGHTVPYYFTGQRVMLDGALHLVGMGVDLTARRALEAQLREVQKMEAVGTLAGGIAHDFNNILGGMLGNLSLLSEALEITHPGRAHLEQLNKAALRSRRLVQQILAFSRREASVQQVQALAPVIEDAVAMLRPMLPAAVALSVRLPPQPVFARVDATQIEQVLLNLCTNAWHALPSSGGRIDVVLDAEAAIEGAAQAQARIVVADNGCGMDAATRSRAFEPFFTTKPVGTGTGLGLSVVHGIVQAHGGRIDLSSQPGQGSQFAIVLPSAAEPDHAPVAANEAPVHPAAAGTRVLYIDDDPTMAVVAQQLLERAGLHARCETDAALAIAHLQADPLAYDVVVTDYNMPELSGTDVARAAHALRPQLPVIVSSGYIDEALLECAQDGRVQGLLNKERTLEDLLPTIGRALAAAGTGRA